MDSYAIELLAPTQSPSDLAIIAGLVVVLAAVQSVFGVGLLVFGTPLLLMLDYPFADVLAYLLPCSIAVSTLQVFSSGGLTLEPIRRSFLRFTAPAVLVGTVVVLVFGSHVDLRPAVGVMLLLTAVLRGVEPARQALGRLVQRRLTPFALGLGALHGLTNLGGGVLTAIVSSTYTDKRDVRRHIAFCYGIMAVIQLATLLLTARPDVPPLAWVALPALTIGSYALVGRALFTRAGNRAYQSLLTALIGSFGVLLVTT